MPALQEVHEPRNANVTHLTVIEAICLSGISIGSEEPLQSLLPGAPAAEKKKPPTINVRSYKKGVSAADEAANESIRLGRR